jgi:hypothetical protein
MSCRRRWARLTIERCKRSPRSTGARQFSDFLSDTIKMAVPHNSQGRPSRPSISRANCCPSARLPTVLSFPAMIFSVPPLVILIPAMLPFGVQIPPAVFGLGAVLALVMDRSVQVCLGLFDRMLTLRSVFRVSQRRRRYEPRKSHRHQHCHCRPSKSSIQGFFLLNLSLYCNALSLRWPPRPPAFEFYISLLEIPRLRGLTVTPRILDVSAPAVRYSSSCTEHCVLKGG